MKKYTLDELTDKYIGEKGTTEREQFEFELKLDILGEMIKKVRKERYLTQEQLGKLVGVQKAQISKIENNIKDVRLSTIVKVFKALKAKVKMTVDFEPVIASHRDGNIFFEAISNPHNPNKKLTEV